MPTYVYEDVLLPEEALSLVSSRKAVRINYWKKFGEDQPGWLVGVGRIQGRKFVLEEEFVAQELVIKSTAYGLIAFLKPEEGQTVDRGWIVTFYENIEFDGRRCVIT
ncbi:MAG: hypothetical protein QW470_01480 [Candidatus Caldarchaeum sp.]